MWLAEYKISRSRSATISRNFILLLTQKHRFLGDSVKKTKEKRETLRVQSPISKRRLRELTERNFACELYKALLSFDKMYYRMTDLEKKTFMRVFIDEIELYPEKQEDGRILKQLHLEFPVFYEGLQGTCFLSQNVQK